MTDPNEKLQFMKDYITAALNAVGDYPYAWDVVNEVISDDSEDIRPDSPWNGVPDFMCEAFKLAKELRPNVKMFYNDYNHESTFGWMQNKSNKVYDLVRYKKNDGCGIDGVGF